MLIISATLPLVFGRMVGSMRQGWVIYSIMLVLFLLGFCTLYAAELAGNPLIKELGVSGISMKEKKSGLGYGGPRFSSHLLRQLPVVQLTVCMIRSLH